VTIVFGPEELEVDLPAGEPPVAAGAARKWLDDQFVANDCEPLRASGKVLTADKLVAVAGAIGLRGFQQNEGLRLAFARATVAALARPVVRIDVDAQAVTF
jgi:DNA-directed RNA polymerase beta' subunit